MADNKDKGAPDLAALNAELAALKAGNTQLIAEKQGLQAELVELERAHVALGKSYDTMLADMMKPAPIVVAQAAPAGPNGTRDAACATVRHHVSGCTCSGDLRGPIA